MKIDIYSHFVPTKYTDACSKRIGDLGCAGVDYSKAVPGQWNIDKRIDIMNRYEGLVQVLTPSGELAQFASPDDAAYLARIYNDELAELVAKYPDKFVAAVAMLPLNNIGAALNEIDKAINELGFKGILINTTINGRPIDLPEIIPIYEAMSSYGLPIWIHPSKPISVPDYPDEHRSKYNLWHCFGWPVETLMAMARLVFSGILEKYPNLKFITHHCGGMMPYLASRIEGIYDRYQVSWNINVKRNIVRPPLEYFRMFYNDAALYGGTPALMCAYTFCGAEHLVFGTDFPYDTELGNRFTRDTIQAIEQMDISDSEKKMIFEDNAKKLMRLPI